MSTRNAVWRNGSLSAQPADGRQIVVGGSNSEEKLMSASVTARRVAVFTLFLFTAWIAATTAASAMRPDPPDPAPQGTTHHAPVVAGGGPDLTVWLLAAITIVVLVAVAAGTASALHRRHLHSPTQPVH
jgi:hypothetical protein